MNEKLASAARALGRRDFLKVTGAGLAAAALPMAPAAFAQDPVELTFWAWCPGSAEMSAKFSEKYPHITVKHENVGQGGPHYVKLRDALKAGSGLPDVAQMEFNSIPSFRALNALADMGADRRQRGEGQVRRLDLEVGVGRRRGLRHPVGFRPDGPALSGRHLHGEQHRRARRPGTPMPRRR